MQVDKEVHRGGPAVSACKNGCDRKEWLDGECRPCHRETMKRTALPKPKPRREDGTFIAYRWLKAHASRFEIYLITGPGYWYVGSTFKTTEQRFKEHLYAARHGRSQTRVAKTMREVGPDEFHVRVLEVGYGDPGDPEQKWMDHYEQEHPARSLNMAAAHRQFSRGRYKETA